MENRNGEDGRISDGEEVDEVLDFVFMEVSIRNRFVDPFSPLLVGPIANNHEHHMHDVHEKEKRDQVNIDVPLLERSEEVDKPGDG